MRRQRIDKSKQAIEQVVHQHYGYVGELKEVTALKNTYLDRHATGGAMSILSPAAQERLSFHRPDAIYRAVFSVPLREHIVVVARWKAQMIIALHRIDTFSDEPIE